jgi:glutamate-1-semialdehyde 2,1-aminomutase
MTTVAIIQARMSSARLPGKVLMTLAGQPVLAWVTRAARVIPGIDKVVLATSVEASDDPVAAWCEGAGVDCYRGPLDNVLARYAGAARQYNADIVMRITADCPLLDPAVCGEVLKLLQTSGCDYATNVIPRTWPTGLDCEAMTAKTLFAAEHGATTDRHREHVTPYIYDHPETFSIRNVPCPVPGLEARRWTLDTPEDYAFLSSVVEKLGWSEIPGYRELLAMGV